MKTLSCKKRYLEIPFTHRQPDHTGHCRYIHGHGWSFEFEFIARDLDACGFVVDFGALKPLKAWLDTFDHALVLNEADPLVKEPCFDQVLDITGRNLKLVPDCSAEGLAKLAMEQATAIVHQLTDGRVTVKRVTVFEDSRNSATVEAL